MNFAEAVATVYRDMKKSRGLLSPFSFHARLADTLGYDSDGRKKAVTLLQIAKDVPIIATFWEKGAQKGIAACRTGYQKVSEAVSLETFDELLKAFAFADDPTHFPLPVNNRRNPTGSVPGKGTAAQKTKRRPTNGPSTPKGRKTGGQRLHHSGSFVPQQTIVPITEQFSVIDIRASIDDVKLLPSQDGTCKALFTDWGTINRSISVVSGVLTINATGLTFFLPTAHCSFLRIEGSSGNIEISQGLSFGNVQISTGIGDVKWSSSLAENLDIVTSSGNVTICSVGCLGNCICKTSIGNIELNDVMCKSLSLNSHSGNATLRQVVASEALFINRTLGDVVFNRSDAPSITVNTTSGNVTGDLLTGKQFIVHSSAGIVSVPEATGSDVCMITTSTGDVKISVPGCKSERPFEWVSNSRSNGRDYMQETRSQDSLEEIKRQIKAQEEETRRRLEEIRQDYLAKKKRLNKWHLFKW